MEYKYKKLNIDLYIESLYKDGLKHSKIFTDKEIKNKIENIGIFRIKGYVKAFRNRLSNFSIDDVFRIYDIDRKISLNMFKLSSDVEIKLKAYLIEIVYSLTDNPFFYLLQDSYVDKFELKNDSIYDWEIKTTQNRISEEYLHYRDYYMLKYDFIENKNKYLLDKKLIELNENINYPPFHYFVENLTLGSLIQIIFKLEIDNNSILKLISKKFNFFNEKIFFNYLLRVKELRNRCAHNGRIFNRNYRGVKAIAKHKEFRKIIYEHKLIDVYYSLYFLIYGYNKFNSVDELIESFINENLLEVKTDMKDWILNILKKTR